jgi:Fe-S cluster assembly iron-binding protein IscA
MALEITEEAAEMLSRSLELGGVDPQTGGIRLRGAHGLGRGFEVQVELADGPLEGEEIVEHNGLRVFIDPGVTRAFPDAIVALDPQHDTIVVRQRT